jgi:hypothetical protein
MFEHSLPVARPPALSVPQRLSHQLNNAVAALRLALPAYLVSRVAVFGAAWAAVAAFGNARVEDPQYPAPLQTWLSWDAVHYLRLAVSGYPANARSLEVGFFPLLPALMHLTSGNALAAVSLAFVLGLAGVAMLTALTRELLGTQTARRTAWIACFWPEAFVLSAVYTEGPFLLLAAAATWAAWRRLPLLAATLGAAAALMRPTGLLLALPLFALLPSGRPRLAAGAPVIAAAGFAGFLWVRTGTPFAYFISQAVNHPVHPGFPAVAGLTSGRADEFVGLAFLVIAALLTHRLWRMRELGRWRVPSLLLVGGLLVPPLSSGTLSSYGRYAAVAFPLFWAASTLRLARLAPFAVPAGAVVAMGCGIGHLTP